MFCELKNSVVRWQDPQPSWITMTTRGVFLRLALAEAEFQDLDHLANTGLWSSRDLLP